MPNVFISYSRAEEGRREDESAGADPLTDPATPHANGLEAVTPGIES